MTSLACNKRSSSIRARKNPRWRAERACVCTCINRAIDPDVLFWRMLALYTVKFHAFIDNPCLCSWIKWISEMNTNESFYLYIHISYWKKIKVIQLNSIIIKVHRDISFDATVLWFLMFEIKKRIDMLQVLKYVWNTTRRERSKKFQGPNWEIVRAVIHHTCSLTWRIYNSLQVCEGERYERAT